MLSRFALALPWIVASVACGSMYGSLAADEFAEPSPIRKQGSVDGRLLIKAASMAVEVGDSEEAAQKAMAIVGEVAGMVERSAATQEGAVDLVVRVPEAQLEAVMKRFEELGDVTRRSLTVTDVTDEVVDLDARMKNLVATRDSLRRLMERATSVQDVVAVERELSRVQGEIDSMEARLKSLRSRVSLSELRLTLKRSQILGPIGYVGKGVWWAVSKLFVIRS